MRMTYSVPATEKNKAFLCTTVRRLFQVKPKVIYRGAEIDPDLAKGDWWIRVRNLPVVKTPHVAFTITWPDTLSPAQRAFINRPGIEVERAYSSNEVLYERIRDRTCV